jgi:hypothetical protein
VTRKSKLILKISQFSMEKFCVLFFDTSYYTNLWIKKTFFPGTSKQRFNSQSTNDLTDNSNISDWEVFREIAGFLIPEFHDTKVVVRNANGVEAGVGVG